MSFLYPLGLLGLIGIPILIVIYIIKSKYTEQTVSSTYLWTLSERFLKKRNPISRVTGLISLILQILAIAAISLAIAHPTLIVPNSANEYCFILDGSGSMNMESNGKTRFEYGKESIAKTIEDSANGSIYSLIYVGDSTNVVFEKLEDKEQALFLLEETKAGYNTEDFRDALGVAQSYFNENPSVLTYLVTDKSYESVKNITVKDMSRHEQNYSISDTAYLLSGNNLTVTGKVVSYESDTALTLSLYIDGAKESSATGTVITKKGEMTPFQLTCETESFSSLGVAIDNKDALDMDNRTVIFDISGENTRNTLIVSDRPLFVKAALDTVINAGIDVVSTKDYSGQSGYGLYVFDSFSPDSMPRDGAVWIINPRSSINESGFSVQGDIAFPSAEPMEFSSSTSSVVGKLSKDMTGDTLYISEYVKCGLYRNFTTLYSYKGNPVIFAGSNTHGNREIVFAFDLHNSNLPLLYDFVVMMRNFVDYSFPDTVEKSTFVSGEEVLINVPAGCQSIRVDTPDNNVLYLDTENATCVFVPTEVGVHTVTVTVANTQKVYNVFASMKEAERRPAVSEKEIALQGEAKAGGFDGKYDMMTLLFIILALLFIADWMVYCYEKYQLR